MMKWSVCLLLLVNFFACAEKADTVSDESVSANPAVTDRALRNTTSISDAAPTRGASPLPTIVVIGDSLSSGLGIAQADGWVTLLRDQLDHSNNEHRVINASISGDTTSGGLARLKKVLPKHHPQLVIIELGGNDGLRGIPLKTIEKNLSAMIELNQQAGARTVLLGMRIPSNYGKRYTEMFHQLYSQLATQHSVPFVDFFMQGVALKPQLMQEDGIHPNARAQPVLLANAWPAISQALEQANTAIKAPAVVIDSQSPD